MIESTKQLGIFFKYSPKRQNKKETSITAVNNERQQDGCTMIKCFKLKTLCETRWVERHTTLQNIAHIYEAIVHCLTAITSRNMDCNWDTKSFTEASGLLMHITNFSKTSTLALCLLPAHLTLLSSEKNDKIKQFFIDYIPSCSSFKSEVSLWKRDWEKSDDKPDTIEKTLSKMNTMLYPNIAMILRVVLLLPVSAATVERGNFSLKLVKNKKRSTMGEDRMNGLLLLNIHRDIKLDYDSFLDLYARANWRRMKFLNPLSD
ncbi:unnamed protein product [Mytilus coruscus]|uniref:HAT C-terminal dimerisation domain-containing protein n=1 Tax=Mytilus coruscus TaxID=42192 RepID=A0A6J8EVR4_MYTCO|nr:unnamed protein product [Mytilus coruscus]